MKTKKMLLTALFAALTAAGAFIRIPAPLTSFTLQFFFTALAGILLGPKWGALSQGIYIALGLVGAPVFTRGGGPGYVFEPSFGFLLGMIPVAFVTGQLTKEKHDPIRVVLACLCGIIVLYVVGLPYMYAILRFYLEKDISISYVFRYGMLVFLPGDLVKITGVTLLCHRILPIARKEVY